MFKSVKTSIALSALFLCVSLHAQTTDDENIPFASSEMGVTALDLTNPLDVDPLDFVELPQPESDGVDRKVHFLIRGFAVVESTETVKAGPTRTKKSAVSFLTRKGGKWRPKLTISFR